MFEDTTTLPLAGNGGGTGGTAASSSSLTSTSATGLGGNTGTLPAGGGSGSIDVQGGVVRGELIPSVKSGSSEKHFVSPKKTDEIPFDYVILKAKGITADQIRPGSNQILEWHIDNPAYGQIDSSNPLKFNVKRDAARHAIVSIGPKGGNTQTDSIKMNVWIVWATVTPTNGTAAFNQYAAAGGAKYEVTASPTTGWRFKFKIEPSDICDPAVAERPDLTGASKKNVPGKGKAYTFNPGLGDGDTASFKWDVSRQYKVTVRNPGSITKAQLQSGAQPVAWHVNQPKAVDTPVTLPTSDVEGNDDPGIADEDANPYQAKSGGNDGLDHAVGELSSVDAPGFAMLNGWGAAGRYFAAEVNFKEFARLELWDSKRTTGKVWFRISDFKDWHHYLDTTFDGTSSQWKDTSSSSGTGHPKP
jgi:hypothetical protein